LGCHNQLDSAVKTGDTKQGGEQRGGGERMAVGVILFAHRRVESLGPIRGNVSADVNSPNFSPRGREFKKRGIKKASIRKKGLT